MGSTNFPEEEMNLQEYSASMVNLLITTSRRSIKYKVVNKIGFCIKCLLCRTIFIQQQRMKTNLFINIRPPL